MKYLGTILTGIGLSQPLYAEADLQERKKKIETLESLKPSGEALERKARSITTLQAHKIPTIDHLPVIGDSKTSGLRTKRQIAERLLGCMITAVAGETGDQKLAKTLIKDFTAQDYITPKESKFIEEKIASQRERVQFSWRYERVCVLLWALGYIDALDYPPSICDVSELVGHIKGKTVEQLIESAKMRTHSEILDEADLIYRLHWAVVSERVSGKFKLPDSIERGVVTERHAALNWLIEYMDQSWDDISTDT